MKNEIVTIVYKDKVLQVSYANWKDVMRQAGQMEDDWIENFTAHGRTKKGAESSLAALRKMYAL